MKKFCILLLSGILTIGLFACNNTSEVDRPEIFDTESKKTNTSLDIITKDETEIYTEVVPCVFDLVQDFKDGLALVQLSGKLGLIDKSGNEIAPTIYRGNFYYPSNISNGMVLLDTTAGNTTVRDGNGNEIKVVNYLNENGEEIIIPKGWEAYSSFFSDGFIMVIRRTYDMYKGWALEELGIMDKTGKINSLKSIYDDISPNVFVEGLAAVHDSRGWGFIDTSGNEVIPLKYNRVKDFSEGLALVIFDGGCGFIDKTGNMVIELSHIPVPNDYSNDADYFYYSAIDTFKEGMAKVINGYSDYYFINDKGEIALQAKYRSVREFSEGLAIISIVDENFENEKYGFIDKTGKEVIPPTYDGMEDFFDGLALVYNNNPNGYGKSYGFIDKNGKVVISLEYEDARSFSEGYAPVYGLTSDGSYSRWGVINKSGKIIVPFQYRRVGMFLEGMAVVQSDETEKYGFISIEKH